MGDDDDNADEITVDNEYDNANKSNNDADDDVVNTVMMMKPNTPETFSSILNLGNSDLFTYVVHMHFVPSSMILHYMRPTVTGGQT